MGQRNQIQSNNSQSRTPHDLKHAFLLTRGLNGLWYRIRLSIWGTWRKVTWTTRNQKRYSKLVAIFTYSFLVRYSYLNLDFVQPMCCIVIGPCASLRLKAQLSYVPLNPKLSISPSIGLFHSLPLTAIQSRSPDSISSPGWCPVPSPLWPASVGSSPTSVRLHPIP
jgi:hypothetical protein